jgi:adenosylcobinamide-GDP ribazoletransferase
VLAALAFLTRLPVRGSATAAAPAALGAAAFGLVGAGLGLVASLPLVVPGPAAPWVAGLLAVAVLAVGSGALHLDGLADTADALVAHGADRAERARRDPAIGAAGAVALVLVLGLEVAAVAQLLILRGDGTPLLTLVIAAAWGRAVAVGTTVAGRSAVAPGGLAAGFARGVRSADVVLAAAVPLALFVVAAAVTRSPLVVVGLGAGMGLGPLLAAGVVRARGSLDGDGLGAGIELAEAAILVVTAIVVAWPATQLR